MSQLNPNAAEFVPRSIAWPACEALINEEVISQSPKEAITLDISLPSADEFDLEVKSRPSDCENFKNAHESDSNNTLMMNSKNNEISKFHTEFYFGPNPKPFIPKTVDQSNDFSTKANHSDETQQTLDDSQFVKPSGEQTDPMPMSFYAEKGESNPFEDEDLNKVHILPDNLDQYGWKAIDKTSSSKKPIGKVEPKKATASKVGATTKAPNAPKVGRVFAKPTQKVSTAKLTGDATKMTTTPTTLKAAPKPKITPRFIEKKPACNAEVKLAPRTPITNKPSTEGTATKTTTRPATTAAKMTPTKTTAPRPATAPRTPASKGAPANSTPVTALKPRVPLSHRTMVTASESTTTAAPAKKTTTTPASKPLLAPKSTTAAAPPKPKTLVSSAPKPRAPPTKTLMKSADEEKGKKESANKLTASRTTTTPRATSKAATTRTTPATVKKLETKHSADRRLQRCNVTIRKKPRSQKSSADLETTITKTTKVEDPEENDVTATTITQEIKEMSIVDSVINQSESETNDLVKGNSPFVDANPAD